MSYNHINKIGNQGDLIKHFVLTTLIKHSSFQSRPVNILETHAGFADYQLEKNDSWKQGIGRFVQRYASATARTDEINYFYQLLNLADIKTHQYYPGSSRIIETCLIDHQITPFNLYLCDHLPQVYQHLQQAYTNQPHIHIYCDDGYAKAKLINSLDLVFIDPPNIEQQYDDYIDLIEYLYQNNIAFVSWNPLHGNKQTQRPSQINQAITTMANSSVIPLISVLWQQTFTEKMCGCQMLVAPQIAENIQNHCQALIDLMQWKAL